MRLKSAKQAKRGFNTLVVPRQRVDILRFFFFYGLYSAHDDGRTIPYISQHIPFCCSNARLTTTGDYMRVVGKKGVIEKDMLLLFIKEVLERRREVYVWHCFVQFLHGGVYLSFLHGFIECVNCFSYQQSK